MGVKFYAVVAGRKPGLYKTWDECKAQTDKFSGAIYKSFPTENEAKKYLRINNIDPASGAQKREKICLLCSKPNSSRAELCPGCNRKKKNLERILTEYSGTDLKVSNKTLLFIKQRYDASDTFALIKEHPEMYFEARSVPIKTRSKLKGEYKQHLRETDKIGVKEGIPGFVYSMLGPTKEPIKVYGERNNPTILYKCKRCGETLLTKYRNYLMTPGHDCDGIKSSGEIIVEEFLKNHAIRYKTQRDTLRCVNPDTGSVMPYDFELIGKRILIEVQGDQHRSFTPRFHVTKEGFEYQKKKDEFKRRFAEKNGYKLIEIWYDELENEIFKEKILDSL